jgi:hypothetical protein
LCFEDILKDAAALPPRSTSFWESMSVDAAVHVGDAALTRLHSVAKAPIFSYLAGFFGREVVGGPMHSVIEGSRQTVAVAIRILWGEKAADIKIPAIGFATPQFNWRGNAALWHQRESSAAGKRDSLSQSYCLGAISSRPTTKDFADKRPRDLTMHLQWNRSSIS